MARRSWSRLLLLVVAVLLAANLAMMAAGGQRPAQAAEAERYQYRVMVVGDYSTLGKRMNEAGAQGWKFETYAPRDTNDATWQFFLIFSK